MHDYIVGHVGILSVMGIGHCPLLHQVPIQHPSVKGFLLTTFGMSLPTIFSMVTVSLYCSRPRRSADGPSVGPGDPVYLG